jgi:hypothetical protein
MTTIVSFGTAAASWQSFYILVGTAAATLMGLMFVAVTFGASLVSAQKTDAPSARAFLDPPFYHFAHVLFVAAFVVVPTMRAELLGGVLLVATLVRFASLARTLRHMRLAQQKFNDLELADWVSGIVVPLGCYLLLATSGVAFVERLAIAFDALAVVTIVTLMLGVYGAWELILWLALTRAQRGV